MFSHQRPHPCDGDADVDGLAADEEATDAASAFMIDRDAGVERRRAQAPIDEKSMLALELRDPFDTGFAARIQLVNRTLRRKVEGPEKAFGPAVVVFRVHPHLPRISTIDAKIADFVGGDHLQAQGEPSPES